MVSVEPHFDLHQDRLWDLDLNPKIRQMELPPRALGMFEAMNNPGIGFEPE